MQVNLFFDLTLKTGPPCRSYT